jgi:hypothetical protein
MTVPADWFSVPSLYAHALQGLLIAVATVLFVRLYPKMSSLDVLKVTWFAAIAVGIHAVSHVQVGGWLQRSICVRT